MSDNNSRSNNQSWSVMSENNLTEKFPLHRACRDGDITSLKALLCQEAARSHITVEDTYYGWTPTHWAAYFGMLDCLRLLVCGVGNGVSAHPGLKTSRFTQTPVHIAAFAGHPHCLHWLLQAGADPNDQDYLGETSLHKAARTGSSSCIEVLLKSKANVGLRNNNGQTAAQLANACSYTELANNLLQLERKEGVSDNVNGAIARSVPAHGLNGGVFPHNAETALFTNRVIPQQQSNPPQNTTNGVTSNGITSSVTQNGICTSSNGYYGFQASNGHKNGHSENSEDCDMETDTPVVKSEAVNGCGGEKGMVMSLDNTNNTPLGFTNGHVNGTVIGFGGAVIKSPKTNTNGFHALGLGEDITLNRAVSQNEIPIGGCKRSREEENVPQMKRMKTEGNCALSALNIGSFSSVSPPSVFRLENSVVADCDVILNDSANKKESNFIESRVVQDDSSTLKTSPSSNGIDPSRRIAADACKTISDSPLSGSCGVAPASHTTPLPPGFSGTMGCLDAHYPRCLMGHYL